MASPDRPELMVMLGTKAQFIKMAPVLRELDARAMPYRLVYTGQHSETFDALERAFGTRRPDENLVPGVEAATKVGFAGWSFAFWRSAIRRLRRREWAGTRMVVVHGDTASTLYGALFARMTGAAVAHVEAGLRSPKMWDPFPEEIIRRCVSRLARLHLAPDAMAVAHLRGCRGHVLDTGGNTLRDSLILALQRGGVPERGGTLGYAIASIHRNENLSDTSRLDFILEQIQGAAMRLPIRFVLHPATRARLEATRWGERLRSVDSIQLVDRMDYPSFVQLMLGASFLMTDGGSNQEEAAMLGLPTLLLRKATERPDGLHDNVVLSELDPRVIMEFVDRYAEASWPVRAIDSASPSAIVVDVIARSLHGEPHGAHTL